jgi:hypothetical protein
MGLDLAHRNLMPESRKTAKSSSPEPSVRELKESLALLDLVSEFENRRQAGLEI